MFRYLAQTADDLMVAPFQICSDLPDMRRGRKEVSNSAVGLVSWYGCSILAGLPMRHRDYEVLRTI